MGNRVPHSVTLSASSNSILQLDRYIDLSSLGPLLRAGWLAVLRDWFLLAKECRCMRLSAGLRIPVSDPACGLVLLSAWTPVSVIMSYTGWGIKIHEE